MQGVSLSQNRFFPVSGVVKCRVSMKVDPRFLTEAGLEIFAGSELLIKGALEAEGGTHLLTGYPGSPVAGFFDAMTLVKDLLNARGIRAVLANNEALAVAMVNGSQLVPCRAIACMKSVGVHVGADALSMGNLAGPHPEGGVIVVYGDDPWSDSTQSPADSRFISRHLFVPVLEPSTPQEVKDFVDLGFRLSHASGLYTGYLLTTNLSDGGGSVECRANQYPRLNTHQRTVLDSAGIDVKKHVLLPPHSWRQEESLSARLAKAVAAARGLGLNRIESPASKRRALGFATSGLAYGYLVQTLQELGLLGEYPMLKFGMSYPIDERLVEELARQCERIIVVEERRGFLEEQIGGVILKGRQAGSLTEPVEVWGKRFPTGLPGLPDTRGLHPSLLIDRLVPLLKTVHAGAGSAGLLEAAAENWDREIRTIGHTADVDMAGLPPRAPSFCPGCPHRDSASVCLEIKKRFMDGEYMRRRYGRGPVDLVFHGDAGCYVILMYPPNEGLMHDYSGMGLGGGTGAGTDPFIRNKQVVFMGDGTFFHSGAIAVSQAIKIGQDITFVILDNRTTAMTGHQPTPGVEYDIVGNPTPAQDVEAVIRGVAGDQPLTIARVDPEKRPEYRDLLEQIFLQDGVKVVIADKECGITRLRRQRRQERAAVRSLGFLPVWQHMNINPEICRFCLACAEYTGCPGLKHAETDYGPKMDTDITWCVDDGACERVRACSAFERVVIKRKRPPRSRVPELGLDDIPEPQQRPYGDLWRCCLAGVGGMGIGLATSIIVRAGHKEGYTVYFVDKKGLAIRNGGVVSQVVYSKGGVQPFSPVIPYGKADLLVGMDVLEAARTLDPRGRMRVASPRTTTAVINTDKVNTVSGLVGQDHFDVGELVSLIRANTRGDDFLARDLSRICEKYLGSKLYANIMMLGFAFQKGLIPVSMHSMAWAIKDTIRADLRKNLYAFNMGRKLMVQPELFQGPPRRTDWRDVLEEKCRHSIRRYRGGGQKQADLLRALTAETIEKLSGVDEELKRAVVVRTYDCMRWGGIPYARRYADAVARVRAADGIEHDFAATRAVVHNLAGAMLVKDAVFVAELATSPEKYARDREKYNVNPAHGDRILYRHLLHPDVRIGKRRFTADIVAYDWMLKLLRRMRFLRKLLPASHRQQRQYLRQYEALIQQFCAAGADRYDHFLERLSSARCLNCANPSCREAGCPLSSRIPAWVELAFEDRWREAAEKLLESNNFPEFTARICPAPCEESCKRTLSGYAVGIRQIELQIMERAAREGWIGPRPAEKKTGRRVAVVGSGPAGLAAAQQLARAGHDVVVYERDAHPGGLLRYGIPDHRLEKQIVDRRLEQLSAEGVVFKCGVQVGKDVSAAELQKEFDAVLLAVGAAVARDLNVPGRRAEGVYFALDFLRREGTPSGAAAVPSVKGKVVAVIGGGLTGADCVEMALREGAREVHQLEILSQEAVGAGHGPAVAGPNVHRRYGVSTKAFGVNGRSVFELQGVQVKWSNSSAGQNVSEVPGTDFSLKIDVALLALGFDACVEARLAEQLHLPLDGQGRVRVSGGKTGVPGVFAAGDVATGSAYVATAIHSGRRAAECINEYLAKEQPIEYPDTNGRSEQP